MDIERQTARGLAQIHTLPELHTRRDPPVAGVDPVKDPRRLAVIMLTARKSAAPRPAGPAARLGFVWKLVASRGTRRCLAHTSPSRRADAHEMLPIRTTVPICGVIHRAGSAN